MARELQQVTFPPRPKKLKRVAAYARVSSGKDAMLHSLSAQISYYSDMIQRHPGWEFAGVFADEAKTGTRFLFFGTGGKATCRISRSIRLASFVSIW